MKVNTLLVLAAALFYFGLPVAHAANEGKSDVAIQDLTLVGEKGAVNSEQTAAYYGHHHHYYGHHHHHYYHHHHHYYHNSATGSEQALPSPKLAAK